MTRRQYCELILRSIYGGQPTVDANITINQVNLLLNPAFAYAAKLNYAENKKFDNIEYVNDSFYARFKGLAIVADHTENFTYEVVLPGIPAAIGANYGLSSVEIRNAASEISQPAVFLNANEWARRNSHRRIKNKIFCCNDGSKVLLYSDLLLTRKDYTANVRMISAGSNDLETVVNIPDEYLQQIMAYVKQELVFEKSQPQDLANDGVDIK